MFPLIIAHQRAYRSGDVPAVQQPLSLGQFPLPRGREKGREKGKAVRRGPYLNI
jgi:hypothetical protein